MIAKTLMDLDRVVYTLAPDFDPTRSSDGKPPAFSSKELAKALGRAASE